MNLPTHGRPRDELFQLLAAYRQHDTPWREGRIFTGIYDPGAEVDAVVKQAYGIFLTENGLYPNLFPSLLQLETDVVRTIAGLVRGDEHVIGNATSGGTESIMLACKAARQGSRRAPRNRCARNCAFVNGASGVSQSRPLSWAEASYHAIRSS